MGMPALGFLELGAIGVDAATGAGSGGMADSGFPLVLDIVALGAAEGRMFFASLAAAEGAGDEVAFFFPTTTGGFVAVAALAPDLGFCPFPFAAVLEAGFAADFSGFLNEGGGFGDPTYFS